MVCRVYVVLEGQTEYEIVKNVVAPRLARERVFLFPIIVHTSPRDRGGGDWGKWERDIRRLLGQASGAGVWVTTIFDLFGLPKGFPGLDRYGNDPDTERRCTKLEAALKQTFDNDPRFIPYIQRHEIEALVLAAMDSLEALFDNPADIRGAAELRQNIAGRPPEDIDDGPDTAPSRRLARFIPGYRKALHGPMAVQDYVESHGLEALRKRCPRFDRWLVSLENLKCSHQP